MTTFCTPINQLERIFKLFSAVFNKEIYFFLTSETATNPIFTFFYVCDASASFALSHFIWWVFRKLLWWVSEWVTHRERERERRGSVYKKKLRAARKQFELWRFEDRTRIFKDDFLFIKTCTIGNHFLESQKVNIRRKTYKQNKGLNFPSPEFWEFHSRICFLQFF